MANKSGTQSTSNKDSQKQKNQNTSSGGNQGNQKSTPQQPSQGNKQRQSETSDVGGMDDDTRRADMDVEEDEDIDTGNV